MNKNIYLLLKKRSIPSQILIETKINEPVDKVVKIISLGSACYSRIFPERFHLYNYTTNKVRMPFDGCTTPYNSVCELINNNFLNFNNDLKISTKWIINKKLNIEYPHERCLNISSLIKQLNLRKDQFIQTLKDNSIKNNEIIIFFLTHNNIPEKLVNIFMIKYPKLRYKIFVLDWSIYPNVKNSINTKLYKYVNIPKPNINYKQNYDHETTIGKIFEKKVLKEFTNFLKEITNIEYDIDNIFKNRRI